MIYSKKDMELLKAGLRSIVYVNNIVLDQKKNKHKLMETIKATNLLNRIEKDEEELPW